MPKGHGGGDARKKNFYSQSSLTNFSVYLCNFLVSLLATMYAPFALLTQAEGCGIMV